MLGVWHLERGMSIPGREWGKKAHLGVAEPFRVTRALRTGGRQGQEAQTAGWSCSEKPWVLGSETGRGPISNGSHQGWYFRRETGSNLLP